MKMNEPYSLIGTKVSVLSGVREIMRDIELSLAESGKSAYNLSAGNPLVVPELAEMWRDCARSVLAAPEFDVIVGRYGSSRGLESFMDAIADDFGVRFGWKLSRKNILVTCGSQSACFFAINSFSGSFAGGKSKKVLLPVSPDYTGYGGASLTPGAITAPTPAIEILGEHTFRYRPAFDQLNVDKSIGIVAFSRPTNPTGNVLTDEDTHRIVNMAARRDTPVLIDSAYAPPYPSLSYVEMTPVMNDNVIHTISLSKAGLPGERIGVVIANEDYIDQLNCFQANSSIHSSRLGQAIATEAIRSGRLAHLSETVLKPFYRNKFAILKEEMAEQMGSNLNWYLHQTEGGLFGWLWLPELQDSDLDLYKRLKANNVFVVPGSMFFLGIDESWPHRNQCIRISLTASDEDIRHAVRVLKKILK